MFTFLTFSHHCKALNSLICADVPLRSYSLTHSAAERLRNNDVYFYLSRESAQSAAYLTSAVGDVMGVSSLQRTCSRNDVTGYPAVTSRRRRPTYVTG